MIRVRIVSALLLIGSTALAGDATAVFRKAVARQGRIRQRDIKSVNLEFSGHVVLDKTEQAVYREYWYTVADRTFRQVTQGKAQAKARSERGVDAKGHWNRAGKSKVRLFRGNRDHRDLIEAIDSDRAEFERILKMVLLTRLEGARFSFATKTPVKLLEDAPFSARSILGSDRAIAEYYVLKVERKNQPSLLLYVKTSDYTVRKAVQFPRDPKDHPVYYYFAYAPDRKLPIYFSAHKSLPTDAKTRKTSAIARGEITVHIERVPIKRN